MPQIIKPRDAADVQDAIQWALSGNVALETIGHGSKRSMGRPNQTDATLDLSGLSGITLYEPNELVFSARAGTSLAEIGAALAAENQDLAFEPPDYGALLGGPAGQGTIGGLIAANLSGPRRIKAGAARDHFLGFTAVSGRGETFKSGGRVIKNVTGYDLCKLMAGSWGTLAVLTDVTFKVLPRAETEQTLIVRALDDATAAKAMAAAMASASDVSSAAHMPAKVAARAVVAGNNAVTALRLEGVSASMPHRRRLLEASLATFGPVTPLLAEESRRLWREIRNVDMLATKDTGRFLWRISTAPFNGHKLVALIAAQSDAEFLYDWAGGLVWLSLPSIDNGATARLREALRRFGGHATLVRAAAAERAALDVFEPQDEATAALTKQVKAGFDPKGILNPGRMYPGI
jgi:glycolate oxidase FAD binding subunit